MYTSPQWRGRGVGRTLVIRLIEMVRQVNGLEQIHLWVLHAHTSASSFYQSVGFDSQGTVVKNDLKIGEQYVDAEYMVYRMG